MSGPNWKYIFAITWILLIWVAITIMSPFLSNLHNLLTESNRLQLSIESADDIRQQIQQLQSVNKSLLQSRKSLLSVIPNAGTISGVYDRLGKLAGEHQVDLVQIDPQPIETLNTIQFLRLQIVTHSSFRALLNFIHQLEKSSGGVRLIALEIELVERKWGQLQGQITLELPLRG